MSQPYDVAALRREFPVVENLLYLDSGFQSPLCRKVRAAFERFLSESSESGGPKSVWLGRVEETRAKVAWLLGASAREIAFTKNTSESMNIAANALPLKAGDNVVMLHGDHPNNAYAFINLKKKGVEPRFLPMAERVDADFFRPHLDARTRAISMSFVTYHAGNRFDIESVGALCREKKIYLVLDIMQAIGVVPIDAKKVGAAMMGSGTHKGLLVPQGLGLLYWDETRVELEPAYLATASLANPPADLVASVDNVAPSPTARRFEIGNYNLPTIQALGAALDFIESIGVANIQEHCYALGDYLIARLDRVGIGLVGPRERAYRAPHIYVIDLPAEDWMDYLAANKVRVSPRTRGIRLSLGLFNTRDDIDRFVDMLCRRNIPFRSATA
jgi:selenocysteine lyase/cysteine desulfurase